MTLSLSDSVYQGPNSAKLGIVLFRPYAAAVVLLILDSVSSIGPAVAGGQPTLTTIVPRVASTAAMVTVSGQGCFSAVDVAETAFMFPGHPKSVDHQTVVPDSSGAWSAVFSMPPAPAYVTATCDGVSSEAIVVAPNDVFLGNMSYSALGPAEIEITTSPLVEGSEFTVTDSSGGVLGTAVAQFGTATVRLPRSLGPAQVVALGLRQPDPGIPELPFVPIALRIQLPLPSHPSVVAEPRVAVTGDIVTASGNCSGSPRLLVTGRAAGWFDIPPNFVDEFLPVDASGSWVTSFPMPSIPSSVTLLCTSGNLTESDVTLISPSDGLTELNPQRDVNGGVLVTIPNVLSPERLSAFTATGASVPIAILGDGVLARLQPTGFPERIVIVGIESLGENAIARQNSRVQGWAVAVGAINDGVSASGLVPAERLSLP